MTNLDMRLLEWATTERQREIFNSLNDTGSATITARDLGCARGTVTNTIAAIKRKAAVAGYSPDHDMTRTVPDGFKVKGVSTYYNKEGKPAGQWVKSSADSEARERMIRAFIESLSESAAKYVPLESPPTHGDGDLLAVYPLGDPHYGLFSWHEETGENFDLKEADRITRGAIDRLVSSAPNAKQALLINLGDFYHADDSSNATPGHGNKLDVDTRYENVMQVGINSLIQCTYRLLEKHENVEVWNVKGNHDPHAYFALSLAMWHHFRDEPRITINTKPADYLYYRFGKCLVAAHHGHGARAEQLPLLMATDRQQDWGETDHRVWHCGHIHHKTRKEHPGCEVETHNTLAGKDAWHHQKGYRSRRESSQITYHREFGEVQRVRVDASMIK